MSFHLFRLLFFTGTIHAVSRKYHLILTEKTWSDAQTYCRATYTDLATYETPDEINQLQNIANSQSCTSPTWIGLYDDVTSWRWSMGNERLGSFTVWTFTNPDNWMAMESCGVIDSNGWADVPCASSYTFICYDGNYTGTSSYIFINIQVTWGEAQSYCRQHHTDLASARNATENSIVMSTIISGYNWFGLFRDSWKWSDQTNFTSVLWRSGDPNNILNEENCVFFLNGETADDQCSILRPFFCESVITGQKQIVRLEIETNQDANDPAVMAAILDKIQQMFSNHGNIAVSYRQQSGGPVFKKDQQKKSRNNTLLDMLHRFES